MVRKATMSAGEKGSSLKRRIQNEDPRVDTSRPSFITIREPSINVASSKGSATEMCLPQRWASLITYDSSSSSVFHTQVVSTDSNLRWYAKMGTPVPSSEMSSTLTSFISTSILPYPTRSRRM